MSILTTSNLILLYINFLFFFFFFFSSRRRHTRFDCDWSSDVCSSDLIFTVEPASGVGQPDPRIDRLDPRPLGGADAPNAQNIDAWHTCSPIITRSEEHTSELQSQSNLVCRLLLEKKKIKYLYSKYIEV